MTFDSSDNLAAACALYAAGALSFDEHAAFAERLAAGWPAAEVALAECERAVLAMVADIPAVVPPPDVKRRLMERIAPTVPDGYVIRQPDEAGFRPTPFPGVTMRLLHVDRPRQQFSCLIRMRAGAVIPHHGHASAEECVVLEGSIRVGGVTMGPGAYQRVEAGVDHVDQWSDTGATVYLTAPLEMLEAHS